MKSEYFILVYTHSLVLVIQAIWLAGYLGLWRYIYRARRWTKAERNRCRELGVLPKFHIKAFLKIHEYPPSADDFEGKKRLAKIDQNRWFVARLKKSKSLFFCSLVDFSKYTNAM